MDRQLQDTYVHDHLDLVGHVVHQVAARYPRHVDRDDLWNAGALGLVDAARRYDPATGVPFGRFATTRIRGAIIDSTRDRDWVTRGVRRRMRAVREGSEAFLAEHGRDATDAELADLLRTTQERVAEVRSAIERATLLQLDQRVGSDDGEEVTLGDLVTERDVDALPDVRLERRELVGAVRAAIAALGEPHREVVERYYFAGEQLRDLADEFGLTEARLSQIRNEAITSVRALLAARFPIRFADVDEDAPGKRRRARYLAETGELTWLDFLAAAGSPDVEELFAAA